MGSLLRKIGLFAAIVCSYAPISDSQLTVAAIDGAGDSITKGYNAVSASPCPNADQEGYNWLTGDTHGASFCAAGAENVFSFLERSECERGSNIFTSAPNHAVSGARMLTDFFNQANNIKVYLNSQPSSRLAAIFLGHNDTCSGTLNKTNASCANADLDPANYCTTRPGSFERELRRGLDILITVPNTRVVVMSPVRLSQLCNFASKSSCQFGSCQTLWRLAGICVPLTDDCSSTRVVDAFNTTKAYRDIIKRVSAEYAAIPAGGSSPIVQVGGAMVGGATLASGTVVGFSDAAWHYKFRSEELSCCDCFHPSFVGQNTLARIMKSGLLCSRLFPCCKETGDPLTDAKCMLTDPKKTYYHGLQ
jgi:hypothetical protein